MNIHKQIDADNEMKYKCGKLTNLMRSITILCITLFIFVTIVVIIVTLFMFINDVVTCIIFIDFYYFTTYNYIYC